LELGHLKLLFLGFRGVEPVSFRFFSLKPHNLRLLEKLPNDHRREQLEQLMLEWNADIAHVYPKFLDVQRLGHDAHFLKSDSWLTVALATATGSYCHASIVFSDDFVEDRLESGSH